MQIGPVSFSTTCSTARMKNTRKPMKTSEKKDYSIYNSSPKDVISKYDLENITKDEFSQMTRELFLNKNKNSQQLGISLLSNQMIENPYVKSTNGLNLVHFPKNGGKINLLDAIMEKYKYFQSLGSSSNNLLDLHKKLSNFKK